MLFTCILHTLQLFMQFGLPRVITSDQGSEFNNRLDKKLMKMMKIDHRLTTPYHPQVTTTLLSYIICYVVTNQH